MKDREATAEDIQDAFRIAVILSGGDRKSFNLWFRTELDLIVGQRGRFWISRPVWTPRSG